MNDYERQRAENIRRNQSLLKQLQLDKPPPTAKIRRPSTTTTSIPSKRRKLHDARPPTRASARISAARRPAYVDDQVQDEALPPRKSLKRQPATKTSTRPAPSQPPLTASQKAAITNSWRAWTPSAPPPSRDENQTLHFADAPAFTPNKTPREILQEGCFGGGYFRPVQSTTLDMVVEGDWEELPEEWIQGLDVERFLTRGVYEAEVNKYKVACGQSIEEWERAGWINHEYDPRGWFQWYMRFYRGRRCADDARQISRWKKCVGPTGRWRRVLLKKYVQMGIKEVFDYGDGEDDEDRKEVSPVVHQTCHHWAYEVRQSDLERFWETGS